MRNILGVSALYHDAAAALVRDGEVLAAAQEERFTRVKYDARFPEHAVDYCLSQMPEGERLDAAVFYEDPVLSLDRVLKNAIEMAPHSERTWPAAAASQLSQKLPIVSTLRGLLPPERADHVYVVDHHLSHAASAFYPSPFQAAAIVVVDGMGEWASTTIGRGRGAEIDLLEQIHYPHSLGLFYSAFTQHCGLKVNSGEYKLMGLAPYGQPTYVDAIREHVIDLREDGSFRLNLEYFGFATSDSTTSEAFESLFGPRHEPEATLTRVQMDLAASAQSVIDEAMLRLARRALQAAGSRNLCLAGGVALNCVTNGKLLKRLPELGRIWVQPASGDAGGALGCALQVAHARAGHERPRGRKDGQRGSLLGPRFGHQEVTEALEAAGLVYQRVEDDAERNERLADLLAEGKIVGRFQGRMEFGPRALGNRSILADPRRPDGQSHINLRIKFRESWRPFAPVVLQEHAAEQFELDEESPYMLLVADLQEDLRLPVDWEPFRSGDSDMFTVLNQERSSLPAITHVDYSARVQTVDSERNPEFHALMAAFHRKTGCPVLVNTSFNVRGEPIICSPRDGVACFVNTGIEVLALGDCLVFKEEQSEAIRDREGSVQFELD